MPLIQNTKTYTTQEVALGFAVHRTTIVKYQLKLIENVDFIRCENIHTGDEPTQYTVEGIKKLSTLVKNSKALEFANQIAIKEAEGDPTSPLFWKSLMSKEALARDYLQNALTKAVEQLKEVQEQLEHKQTIINQIAEGAKEKSMRAKINQIVKNWVKNRAKEANRKEIQPDYRIAWGFLSSEFCYTYGIDLKTRCKNYKIETGKKVNRLEMAESLGELENLYLLATKLFEAGVIKPLDLEPLQLEGKIFID